MNFRDIFSLSLRNLLQAKLRTVLTTIGVIVGVAAIVTMVSFGIGLQDNLLRDALGRIDLLTSINVIGPGADAMLAMREGAGDGDNAIGRRLLDDAAIDELRSIPDVRYVNPQLSFDGYVRFEGHTRRIGIGGAPLIVSDNPRFMNILAGGHFSSGDAREAVITERFLQRLRSKSIPRGSPPRQQGGEAGPFRQPPTRSDEERQRDARAVLGSDLIMLTLPGSGAGGAVFGIPLPAMTGFEEQQDGDVTPGFEEHRFKIVGVLKSPDGIDFQLGGNQLLYLPFEVARQFREGSSDPLRQMGEMLAGGSGYQGAEIRVADIGRVEAVKEEIRRRGFNFISLGNQIEEIKRVFLIVNASLAVLGGLALLVASFGISNTMIMSIRERTREIGIMKAIGGSDGEVMRIFFVEACLIGVAGGVIGVICGWGIDRIANLFANRWIAQQAGRAVRHIEFFSIPWYLSGGAILFALLISLVAAIYPASRAAKVDPIIALK